MNKKLGVLCHVSSIPSKYGVGDFGKSSKEFIDFLARNNLQIWQILPLNITNKNNCPYSSACSYSIEEMYIDPEYLLETGKIDARDLITLKKLAKTKKVSFDLVKKEKNKLLEKAYTRIDSNTLKEVEEELKNSTWLYEYCYFRAMLQHFNVENFREIPNKYWDKDTKEYKLLAKENKDLITKYAYFQWLLNKQWQEVRNYAKINGILILGDLPIYPDPNSFDVFLNRDQFKLDKATLEPLVYGGVPADAFCKDGQNWGTCVYDWDYMKSLNYSFMLDKIKTLLTKYDILRLDHFLGYVEHYEWDAKNLKKGKWLKKGGEDFFSTLQQECDMNRIVIEDLGLEKKEATNIRNKFNLKGMCVIQMILENPKYIRYAPDKVAKDSLYYLGTHDNNTFMGYLKNLNKEDKIKLCNIVGVNKSKNKDIHLECIRKMIQSNADTVILQIQDYLMQGEKYRMNVPGQAEGWWEYKMPNRYESKVISLLKKVR